MISSLISAKTLLAIFTIVSVGSVAGVVSHSAMTIGQTAFASSGNLTVAENAAIAYVDQNYPGNGTAKIIKVENDVEHGVAVFDINVLAPNGLIYVVHIEKSNNSVMSAHIAENQNYNKNDLDKSNDAKDQQDQSKSTETENQSGTGDK